MTSLIADHEKLKQEQDRINQQLAALEEDANFQRDKACKEAIQNVLEQHDKTPQALVSLFPEINATATQKKASARKPPATKRPLIRYIHPDTNETVESRGLNKKELQAWSKEYGPEKVKSWGVHVNEEAASKDATNTRTETQGD